MFQLQFSKFFQMDFEMNERRKSHEEDQGWIILFWFVNIPVSFFQESLESVIFVIFLLLKKLVFFMEDQASLQFINLKLV